MVESDYYIRMVMDDLMEGTMSNLVNQIAPNGANLSALVFLFDTPTLRAMLANARLVAGATINGPECALIAANAAAAIEIELQARGE